MLDFCLFLGLDLFVKGVDRLLLVVNALHKGFTLTSEAVNFRFLTLLLVCMFVEVMGHYLLLHKG